MQRATPFEYILCTINGYIEYIQVVYNNDNLIIHYDSIEHNLMIDNNQILGMVTTSNKVGWLFALNRNKLKEKSSCLLSLCSLNVNEPLGFLLNAKNYYMEKYLDCCEVIRLKLLIEYDCDDYLIFKPKLIQMNEDFIHRLRIRRIIVNGLKGKYR